MDTRCSTTPCARDAQRRDAPLSKNGGLIARPPSPRRTTRNTDPQAPLAAASIDQRYRLASRPFPPIARVVAHAMRGHALRYADPRNGLSKTESENAVSVELGRSPRTDRTETRATSPLQTRTRAALARQTRPKTRPIPFDERHLRQETVPTDPVCRSTCRPAFAHKFLAASSVSFRDRT